MAIEPKRGCGYRKVGGIYLVSGGLSEACHRLPIPLENCPVCGEGIKFSRGFTWIQPLELIGGPCDRLQALDAEHCGICPACDPGHVVVEGRAGLLWVGERHYTIEEFQKEAQEQGVSKRISSIPRDFKIGETWVFLAHKKAVFSANDELKDIDKEIKRIATGFAEYDAETIATSDMLKELQGWKQLREKAVKESFVPGIFTAFKPEKIEKIIKQSEFDAMTEDEHIQLEKQSIYSVPVPDDDPDHQ